MTLKFSLLLFITLLTLNSNVCPQSSGGGFNSIHTPDGENIIAVGDSGLYFRSSNSGNTWISFLNDNENMKSVFSLGNDVWISADDGKIFKTFIFASPLILISTGTTESLNSIFFINSSIGFVCGDNGVILKTTDDGLTWSLSNTNINNVNLNSISFKDESNGIAVGDGGKIYLTIDGGLTWALQPSLTSSKLLSAKYFNDGIGIVGEDGVIIVKFGSGNFELINTRTDSDIRGITGSGVNEIHVCGGGGFIRNNKNGVSNFFNFEINPMMANLVDIYYHDNLNGWAVSSLNKVIIRTTNGGESWNMPPNAKVNYSWEMKLNPGRNGYGNTICKHPYDKYSIFVMYGNMVYVSRDEGNTWNHIATGNISNSVPLSFYISPIDTNIWIVATRGVSFPSVQVIRTTNYGQNWSTILMGNATPFGQPLEMDQNDPSIFYFAPTNEPGEGLYKSIDTGSTFNLIAPYNQSAINGPCDIFIMWDSSNVIFVGDTGADIWKSTDGGISWFIVKPSSSAELPSISSSVFKGNQIYATTWPSGEVYRSVDYGNNWSVITTNPMSGWGSDVCREDPTVVLIGSYSASAFLTTNNGTSFSAVSSGLFYLGAGIMVKDRSTLLDQRVNGLYKLKITYDHDVSIKMISTSIPESFKLFQNYPNPFNPETKIKFSLPQSGFVSLVVYDISGREVIKLVNDKLSTGTYEYTFDGAGLTSGVYFYRLTAAGFVKTKKMILLR